MIDDSTRARIAQGWRTTSLDQATYAAQFSISTRCLREWVRRFGAGRRPEAQALAVIDEAIERLRALRTAVAAEAACQVGEGVPVEIGGAGDVNDQPKRHANPEQAPDPVGTEAPVTPPALVGRIPMPGPGVWL